MKEPLDEGERGEWNIWQANVCLVKARVFSEQDPVSPLSQFLPSRSFHKPLILIHQKADRLKTTVTENEQI